MKKEKAPGAILIAREIAKRTGIDEDVAYEMLVLEAILYDLSPSDDQAVIAVFSAHEKCGSR